MSTAAFPQVRLPGAGGLPVEVTVLAQLDPGAGSALIAQAGARQQAHPTYRDALDEPSAQIGAPHLAEGDATALYTFSVGKGGHPFHRHAGARMFTAIAGSGGAVLRFATLSDEAIHADPAAFARAVQQVRVPSDALFTVRFGGGTWHQFAPERGQQSAFFALSCHPDELGGALSDAVRAQVEAGEASIPALTDVLPEAAAMAWSHYDRAQVPTWAVGLRVHPEGAAHRACRRVRRVLGWWRQRTVAGTAGYVVPPVVMTQTVAADSLLRTQFTEGFHHEDTFALRVPAPAGMSSSTALAVLLDGFVSAPPRNVARWMALRNQLVKPLGWRTSPLGCPVSSLLGPCDDQVFAGRFPVWGKSITPDLAQVILGADDRHLAFRSCVAVRREGQQFVVTLGTRVRCAHRGGRIYLALIDRVHRTQVGPALLRAGVETAFGKRSSDCSPSTPSLAIA